MFKKIIVPRSANSSYYGILTEKDTSVAYEVLGSLENKTVVFIEGTDELMFVNKEDERKITGTWIIRDAETFYRCAIGVHENRLIIVADKKGISYLSDTANHGIYEETLKSMGIYDQVQEGIARRGQDV